MAAGAQANKMGWRWSYRTLVICNSIIFLLFLAFYEETKYVPTISESTRIGTPESSHVTAFTDIVNPDYKSEITTPTTRSHEIDHNIPLRPWYKRLAVFTPTSESIWPYYYRPFLILFKFPAILISSLTYSCVIAWITIMTSVLAIEFPLPPYNFTPDKIGFMNTGLFVGYLIGVCYGGILGDRSIIYLSRRNKGYYEPEMRLYILPLPALGMAGGLITFGVTLSKVGWISFIEMLRVLISSLFRACFGSSRV